MNNYKIVEHGDSYFVLKQKSSGTYKKEVLFKTMEGAIAYAQGSGTLTEVPENSKEYYATFTVAQLKKELEDKGIAYNSKSRKSDLMALLKEHLEADETDSDDTPEEESSHEETDSDDKSAPSEQESQENAE